MKKIPLLKNLAILLVVSLVLSLCACGGDGTQDTQGVQDTTVADATEGVPVLDASTKLYFNIDRITYGGLAEDGLTARPKNLTDAYFHFNVASDGEVVELLCKSRMLANQVDTYDVVTFTFKDDGLIDQVYSLQDMGGKIAADRLYVSAVADGKVTINTNNTMTGDEFDLNLSADVVVYDLSDAESDTYGAATELAELDEIVAIENTDGVVTHIWVMSRAAQRTGEGGCICGANDTGKPHLEGCDGSMLYFWKPWTSETSLPSTSGYWYMDVPGGVINMEANIMIKASSEDIFLDLRGHTINGPVDTNIYHFIDDSTSTNLTICDSVGGGKIVLRDSGKPQQIQGKFLLTAFGKHSFTLYGGTIDGSGLNANHGNGGIIRSVLVPINIHGGEIIGPGGTTNAGGVVWCSGAFTMTGGKISGGTAKKGGNIFIGYTGEGENAKYGSFTMTGGEITGGTASAAGGNVIYAEGADFNLNGGTVSGGNAPKDPDYGMNAKPSPAD